MPHAFYIISEKDAAFLSASFTTWNGQKGRFLIVEASDNRQGRLPRGTWYLLHNKRQMPKER